jgi:glycogen operon protein
MISLRKAHPLFHRNRFFVGREPNGRRVKDLAWFNTNGNEIVGQEWHQLPIPSLGVYLLGANLDEIDPQGRPIKDDDFLLLINAHHEPVAFQMPRFRRHERWQCIMDTDLEQGLATDGIFASGDKYLLNGRSVALLIRPRVALKDEDDPAGLENKIGVNAKTEELLYSKKKNAVTGRWSYKR